MKIAKITCKTCGKPFSHAGNLKKHNTIHEHQKDYKSKSHARNLKKHSHKRQKYRRVL